ncbi:hypothetical protein KL86DPRO_70111 [uncultured delta proteobacterium]|uniref:Uncharacterized protein n=1 Tax=uncultured delta proteobacterium TaxID=34034 RepID=A0A212KGU9_9DELT|nr:hypothetical protein KL86DPRO_70111 [uncultured delta proteobacterium]
MESLQKKLSKENRGDGPYKASARTRLFYIVELYVALVVITIREVRRNLDAMQIANSPRTDGN